MFAGYHQPNNFAQGGLDSFNLLKDPSQIHQGYPLGSEKFYNFTCGRIDLMGNIVTKSAPYLYPFVIEFSLIIAAILLVMWLRIGKNPRWGDSSNFSMDGIYSILSLSLLQMPLSSFRPFERVFI